MLVAVILKLNKNTLKDKTLTLLNRKTSIYQPGTFIKTLMKDRQKYDIFHAFSLHLTSFFYSLHIRKLTFGLNFEIYLHMCKILNIGKHIQLYKHSEGNIFTGQTLKIMKQLGFTESILHHQRLQTVFCGGQEMLKQNLFSGIETPRFAFITLLLYQAIETNYPMVNIFTVSSPETLL